MKVIPKNCTKKQGENRKKRNMAVLGCHAYLEAKPKKNIEAIHVKEAKAIK